MEKPLTLRRAEFNQSLAKVITDAGLPPFIIADCLSMTLLQVQELAEQQYKRDKLAYEQSCNNNEEIEVQCES